MASTIKLRATADFGQSGQYLARITGRSDQYTFERQFVGRKEGKRGDLTVATIDEPGLYEVRDATRKGKRTSYDLVLRNAAGDLEDLRADEADALKIARMLDEGKAIASIAYVDDEGWYYRAEAPAPAPAADSKAEAVAKIKALMTEHGITADDLRD